MQMMSSHQHLLRLESARTNTELFKMGGKAKRAQRAKYEAAKASDENPTKLPQKRFYRQRAHANPFSDHHLL